MKIEISLGQGSGDQGFTASSAEIELQIAVSIGAMYPDADLYIETRQDDGRDVVTVDGDRQSPDAEHIATHLLDWKWQAEKDEEQRIPRIALYEDNAGRLTLWHEADGYGYTGLEHCEGARFTVDAKCLANGATDDWTVERVEEQPEGEPIARWCSHRCGIEILGRPGITAQKYLRLPTHEE